MASAAVAATLRGEVVGLADGDTVTVLDASKTTHKIRLAGIDAPEKRQPFGERARQNLSTLVFRKQVTVEWSTQDRYGRIVGKVLVNGEDAGLAQIRSGLAWHYKAYQRQQAAPDRVIYADAESAARQARRGLWSEAAAVAPWDFRRERREAGARTASGS
jgi:endonuclease YncB( thermonuclease family)